MSNSLTDPAFEPSDEQLVELSTRAFAGLRAAQRRRLERLRDSIARERERVLRALDSAPPERQPT
jgi:hypothetical protein